MSAAFSSFGKTIRKTFSNVLFIEYSSVMSQFMEQINPQVDFNGVLHLDGRKFDLQELAMYLDMSPLGQRDPFHLRHTTKSDYHEQFQPDSIRYKLSVPFYPSQKAELFGEGCVNLASMLVLAASRLNYGHLKRETNLPEFHLPHYCTTLINRQLEIESARNPLLVELWTLYTGGRRNDGTNSYAASPTTSEWKLAIDKKPGTQKLKTPTKSKPTRLMSAFTESDKETSESEIEKPQVICFLKTNLTLIYRSLSGRTACCQTVDQLLKERGLNLSKAFFLKDLGIH